jgi:hypothetical protein
LRWTVFTIANADAGYFSDPTRAVASRAKAVVESAEFTATEYALSKILFSIKASTPLLKLCSLRQERETN